MHVFMLDHGVRAMCGDVTTFCLIADTGSLSVWDASPSLMKVREHRPMFLVKSSVFFLWVYSYSMMPHRGFWMCL